MVAAPGASPAPTGADRTTVMAFIADDHPGALLELLTEFAVRGVNLTRIESRPTGVGLGRYYFSIDAEGHIAQARVAETLAAIRRECADVRFLGSYPRADGLATVERTGTSDVDFADAHAWVQRIRSGD
jgi:prephenate dehydratase